jgi:hypothetical protein
LLAFQLGKLASAASAATALRFALRVRLVALADA